MTAIMGDSWCDLDVLARSPRVMLVCWWLGMCAARTEVVLLPLQALLQN